MFMSLELGGKAANVVFADADLDRCIESSVFSVFGNCGQDCCARSRILIQRSIYEEFIERFTQRTAALKVGQPLDETSEIGPLISLGQRQRSLEYVTRGIQEDARLVLGGAPIETDGYFMEPAVFVDVDNQMRVAQKEIFGPVACLIPFESEQEALRLANETPYGLSGSAWTQNLGRALRVAKGMRAGVLSVNSSHSVHTEAPFGGYKQSGIGREMGMHAAQLYKEWTLATCIAKQALHPRVKRGCLSLSHATRQCGAGISDPSTASTTSAIVQFIFLQRAYSIFPNITY